MGISIIGDVYLVHLYIWGTFIKRIIKVFNARRLCVECIYLMHYHLFEMTNSRKGVLTRSRKINISICCRNLQCLQSNQQGKRPNVFDNRTYDDNIVKNQGHDHIVTNTTPAYNNNQGRMDEEDGIYVEKQEEEYDHLHSSRQKHITKDIKDNEYGTASYLEDNSYSTLRQGSNSNPEPDLDNEYSTMPSLENNGSSMGNPEYDFCYQMDQRKDW